MHRSFASLRMTKCNKVCVVKTRAGTGASPVQAEQSSAVALCPPRHIGLLLSCHFAERGICFSCIRHEKQGNVFSIVTIILDAGSVGWQLQLWSL